VSDPNCPFSHQTTETISHIFFDCSFSSFFWNEISEKIFNKLSSCGCLSLEYREIILGFLTGEMDLLNYLLILGKHTCGLAGAKKRNHLSDTLKEFY